ncbi:hypothetical protein BCV69DRAFT_313429 [Microstroma glucosiphilum]|uniref:Dynamin-type G domain-containing protein n=1 Tax=Pseudomicrostroma glucosiphilum TaxID=1684307 RepID=A0A316U3C2_9BASI|nr:hypothetical protein BCV69DRAFT_313429 [Pseudomicrostroma glucosiphilum]PWN19680.1 hypothetical protein BCV69DRAFT_313429 [Pseudomicrostroma glucosiphilum]
MGSQQYYRPNAFAGRSFSSYTAGPSTPTIGLSSAATQGTASASGTATPDYFQHAHSRSHSLPSSADVVSSPVAEGWKGGSGVVAEVDEESQREKVAAMEEHQRRFAEARDGLIAAIDDTSEVLTSLRQFNGERWIVHYPAIDRRPDNPERPSPRRAQSVAPRKEGGKVEEGSVHATPLHPGMMRCSTEAPHHSNSMPVSPTQCATPNTIQEEEGETREQEHHASAVATADDQSEMSVLRLDLKLGAAGNNPQALVRSLEKSSVAQLLDERMTSSIRQLDSLRERISDTQSKVLVTGDLNAGKSTFVNALMRRKLMPVDQQPCTTVFCEVLDAEQINEGREEVHKINPGMSYDVQNANTYTRHTLEDVEGIVAEAEDVDPQDAPLLKCYCHDTRSTQESLLRNGIVDIALIDAPGLNRDSLKTTALFARQEQIDVVVFVVSAENHFTLSAKEFLWNASNDKAYIFIVVNKFDQIRNKEKCRRLVLEQIKQLSPRTYEDAEELVHFVDSSRVMGGESEGDSSPIGTPMEGQKVAGDTLATSATATAAPSFSQLEACLRDFVLQRREKSKLMPAQTYLLRLLSDIDFLASTNLQVANGELEEARRLLEAARPALAKCQAAHAKMEHLLEGEEDTVTANVAKDAQEKLSGAVELIAQGRTASPSVTLPAYPGFFGALDYAAEVRDAFLRSLAMAVGEAEEVARGATTQGVARIREMGEAHLPTDVERSGRVFFPEKMFTKRLARGSVAGLGLGADITEARMSDVFDLPHYIHIVTKGDGEEDDVKDSKRTVEEEVGLISGLSLGVGALTLFGGKAYGAKSALGAILNFSNLVANPTVRKWAPTVVAVATAGFVVYVIHDLPNSIPRNVGRSMKKELAGSVASGGKKGVSSTTNRQALTVAPSSALTVASPPLPSFSTQHSERLSREVRKVLRMAGWDLQERFRVALAERKGQVDRLEGQERRSVEAIEWFGITGEKVRVVRGRVREVRIA